eukprot:sb/3477446/
MQASFSLPIANNNPINANAVQNDKEKCRLKSIGPNNYRCFDLYSYYVLVHGTYEKRFTPAIEHPSFNIQWKSGFVIKCHSDYVLPLWSSNNLSEDLKEYKQIGIILIC